MFAFRRSYSSKRAGCPSVGLKIADTRVLNHIAWGTFNTSHSSSRRHAWRGSFIFNAFLGSFVFLAISRGQR